MRCQFRSTGLRIRSKLHLSNHSRYVEMKRAAKAELKIQEPTSLSRLAQVLREFDEMAVGVAYISRPLPPEPMRRRHDR